MNNSQFKSLNLNSKFNFCNEQTLNIQTQQNQDSRNIQHNNNGNQVLFRQKIYENQAISFLSLPANLHITKFIPDTYLETKEIQQQYLDLILSDISEEEKAFQFKDIDISIKMDLVKQLIKDSSYQQNLQQSQKYQQVLNIVIKSIISENNFSQKLQPMDVILLYLGIGAKEFHNQNQSYLTQILVSEVKNIVAHNIESKEEKYYILFSIMRTSGYNKKKHFFKFFYDEIMWSHFNFQSAGQFIEKGSEELLFQNNNLLVIYSFLFSQYVNHTHYDNYRFINKIMPLLINQIQYCIKNEKLTFYERAFLLNNLKELSFKEKEELLFNSDFIKQFQEIIEKQQEYTNNDTSLYQTFYNLSFLCHKSQFDYVKYGNMLFQLALQGEEIMGKKVSILNIARALIHQDIFHFEIAEYLLENIHQSCQSHSDYSENTISYQVLFTYKKCFPDQFEELINAFGKQNVYKTMKLLNNQYLSNMILQAKFVKKNKVSDVEIEIKNLLKTNFPQEKVKDQVKIGLFNCDFVINKTILEIYGNHHYIDHLNLNFKEEWRKKVLEACGYKFKSIQTHKWNQIQTEDTKINYLKQILVQQQKSEL